MKISNILQTYSHLSYHSNEMKTAFQSSDKFFDCPLCLLRSISDDDERVDEAIVNIKPEGNDKRFHSCTHKYTILVDDSHYQAV